LQALVRLHCDLPLDDVQKRTFTSMVVARLPRQALGLHDPGVVLAPGTLYSLGYTPPNVPALLVLLDDRR
jgi:hypothetical protein